MRDDMLRFLMLLVIGVMFIVTSVQINSMIFQNYEDALDNTILIGLVGIVLGIFLSHEFQGFSQLLGNGFIAGGVLSLGFLIRRY
jgi:hypothetical protein